MNILKIAIGMILGFPAYGCVQASSSDYSTMVRSGFSKIPAAVQMEELYKDVDHFVGSQLSPAGTRQWNTEAFLYGRYILTMQIEVIVNRSRIEGTVGEPVFYLSEVEEVTDNNGIPGVDFYTPNQRTFGPSEWDAIYKANGDMTSINLKAVKDKPIPRFDVFRAAVGRNRIKVLHDGA